MRLGAVVAAVAEAGRPEAVSHFAKVDPAVFGSIGSEDQEKRRGCLMLAGAAEAESDFG